MKRQVTRQSVKASLNGIVKSSDLSKERLEMIVECTSEILGDSSMSPSDQLLKIIKLYGHYDLV